ncbi:DUF2577 domain-containing protein [Tepidimicrobium xylanilyticum]
MIQIIKQAALEAVENSSPMGIAYGTVTSVSPLEINVEQRMNIKGDMILLTSNVIDSEVEIEVNDMTEEALTSPYNHKHEYKGTKKHIHKKGLKVGEKVLLIRVQGGQKYIVLDRLVSV